MNWQGYLQKIANPWFQLIKKQITDIATVKVVNLNQI